VFVLYLKKHLNAFRGFSYFSAGLLYVSGTKWVFYTENGI